MQPSRVDFHECALKEQGCQSFIKPGHAYDIDGDGAAETPEEVTASYFAWGPAFVAAMRAKLGAKRLILANSAGAISDSSAGGPAGAINGPAHYREYTHSTLTCTSSRASSIRACSSSRVWHGARRLRDDRAAMPLAPPLPPLLSLMGA